MSSDNEARSRRVVLELFSSLHTESQNHGVVPLPFLVSDGIRVEIWNAASMFLSKARWRKNLGTHGVAMAGFLFVFFLCDVLVTGQNPCSKSLSFSGWLKTLPSNWPRVAHPIQAVVTVAFREMRRQCCRR